MCNIQEVRGGWRGQVGEEFIKKEDIWDEFWKMDKMSIGKHCRRMFKEQERNKWPHFMGMGKHGTYLENWEQNRPKGASMPGKVGRYFLIQPNCIDYPSTHKIYWEM